MPGGGSRRYTATQRSGLEHSPELWNWSSFRSYALGEPGVAKIKRWDVLKLKNVNR